MPRVTVQVLLNGVNQYRRSLRIQSVAVDGGEGNDRITIQTQGSRALPVMLDGGAGNDVLFGSLGQDILRGGAGDDQLWGGGNLDVLDGGEGLDMIEGVMEAPYTPPRRRRPWS